MNCRDNGRFTIEEGWILSKNQGFRKTKQFQEVMEKAINLFYFKTEKTIEAAQEPEDCDYDYIEYYPDGPSVPNPDPLPPINNF